MAQLSPKEKLKTQLEKVMNFEYAHSDTLNKYRNSEPEYHDLYKYKYKTFIIAVLLIIGNNLLKIFANFYISDLYIFTVPLFAATAYGTYRTLKRRKTVIPEIENKKRLLKEYKEIIAEFDKCSKAYSETDIYRWWEKFDRVAELEKDHWTVGHLTWYPLEKYYFDEEKEAYYLRKFNTCNEGTLSGESVKEIFFGVGVPI